MGWSLRPAAGRVLGESRVVGRPVVQWTPRFFFQERPPRLLSDFHEDACISTALADTGKPTQGNPSSAPIPSRHPHKCKLHLEMPVLTFKTKA